MPYTLKFKYLDRPRLLLQNSSYLEVFHPLQHPKQCQPLYRLLHHSPAVSRKSIVVAQAKRPTPKAPAETPFKRLEENRIAKEVAVQSAERDYFPFVEQLNGRAAMIGSFIGAVTEAVTSKQIVEQLKIIFSPLL